MYRGYQEEKKIDIRIYWEPNTARGFLISLVIFFFLLFLISFVKYEPPTLPIYEQKTIPLELINFGLGDGTGLSKGNLSAEGMAHKGKSPSNQLEDASIAAPKGNKPSQVDDPLLARQIQPTNQLSSEVGNKNNVGTGSKDIGKQEGAVDGTGLGDKGYGQGAGYGLGDIEWGGGGNRIVLYKVLPKYPAGYNVNAQIKLKFTVSADGVVTSIVPLQKGDPVLERAAIEALRQWRFNRLKENKEMYGIITFTFKVS
ncbi:MAG: TonB family protein [Ignavibacteria bacterium]|nr:TonB family protein [Ignavibacteria bacterium]